MASFHYLTKSRYMQGLQCPKLLWLSINEPELGAEIDEATQHIFDVGKRVGEIAQKRYKDGVLIAEDHMHLQDALRSTENHAGSGAPAMFEAAAKFETVLCRADILQRTKKDLWEIHEVKMSTSVKEEHLDDLAIQQYCFDRAGYSISRDGQIISLSPLCPQIYLSLIFFLNLNIPKHQHLYSVEARN
jgi:hypothetical protein